MSLTGKKGNKIMVFQNTKHISPIGPIIKESLISPHHCKWEIVRGLTHCIDKKEGVRRASTNGSKGGNRVSIMPV